MRKPNNNESSSSATTYIAPGTKLVGNLTGEGPYIFCGETDGECDIKGPVTVAEGSLWKGSVRATDIVIAGKVEGDVVAKKRVELTGTAHVTGSLKGASIVVAEGAVIEGEVSIADAKEPDGPKLAATSNVSSVKP
jgi:cytoskeletal protein CcmA (bactofilin family)